MRFLARTDRWLQRIESAAMGIAVVALGLIMVLLTVDAALRYALNRPLPFTFDLTSMYLMEAAFFLALSHALRKNDHVAIELLVRRMPRRLRHLSSAAVNLLAIGFFLAVFWEGADFSWQSWIDGEVKTGAILWPIWASAVFVPLGVGLLLLRLAHGTAIEILLAAGLAPGVLPAGHNGAEDPA